VRETVIVIADLYLPRAAQAAAPEAVSAFAALPGIQSVGRFGAHAALGRGWREWLAGCVGRADLAGVAPARIAAALLARPAVQQGQASTSWIATPLQLTAGLSRVHLDPRGIMRLPPTELDELAADFDGAFGSSGFSLAPLSSGDFLLQTRGIDAVDTVEPARCAGGDVAEALPRGAGAAPLRRLMSEIEMWLHGLALNERRRARGAAPVTGLWPWGAAGRTVTPALRPVPQAPLAFGRDAWLEGLWRLQGSLCRPLPQHLQDVLAGTTAERCVLVAEAGGELQRTDQLTLAEAVARLDERFVSPALRALRRGELAAMTLVINDSRVTVRRGHLIKLWRRPRAGLAGFA